MPSGDSHSGFDLALKVTMGLMFAFGVVTQGMGPASGPIVVLVLIAVGLFGIPHGAFDYALAKKLRLVASRKSACLFLAIYLFLATGSFCLWMVWPLFGLISFLTLSAWHFSHDWQGRGGVFRAALAMLVVFGPLVIWPNLVLGYFNVLLFDTLPAVSPHFMTILAGLLATLWVAACFAKLIRGQWVDLLEAVVLLACVLWFEPLLFFVIYFCGLHSVRSLVGLRRELGGSAGLFIRRCLLPTLGTYVLGLIAYFSLPAIDSDAAVLRIIFIGLFALTIPHLLLDIWIGALRPSATKKCSADMAATISV